MAGSPLLPLSSGTRFGAQTQPDLNIISAIGSKNFCLRLSKKMDLGVSLQPTKMRTWYWTLFHTVSTQIKGKKNCRLIKIKLMFLAIKYQGVYFEVFSSRLRLFSAKLWLHGRTAEIKSLLVFYPHPSRSRSHSRKNEYELRLRWG